MNYFVAARKFSGEVHTSESYACDSNVMYDSDICVIPDTPPQPKSNKLICYKLNLNNSFAQSLL